MNPRQCIAFLTARGCPDGNACPHLHVMPSLCAGYPTAMYDDQARAARSPAPLFDRPVKSIAYMQEEWRVCTCAARTQFERVPCVDVGALSVVAVLPARSASEMASCLGRPDYIAAALLSGARPAAEALRPERKSDPTACPTGACPSTPRRPSWCASPRAGAVSAEEIAVPGEGEGADIESAAASACSRTPRTASIASARSPFLGSEWLPGDRQAPMPDSPAEWAVARDGPGVGWVFSARPGGCPVSAGPPPHVAVFSSSPASSLASADAPCEWTILCSHAHQQCCLRWAGRVLGIDYVAETGPSGAVPPHAVQFTCPPSQMYACAPLHVRAAAAACPAAATISARLRRRRRARRAAAAARMRPAPAPAPSMLLGPAVAEAAGAVECPAPPVRRRARSRSFACDDDASKCAEELVEAAEGAKAESARASCDTWGSTPCAGQWRGPDLPVACVGLQPFLPHAPQVVVRQPPPLLPPPQRAPLAGGSAAWRPGAQPVHGAASCGAAERTDGAPCRSHEHCVPVTPSALTAALRCEA